MNVLSYERSDANGGSFTLLVDGRPLAALHGGMDREVPFYLAEEDDLPRPTDSAVLQWVSNVPPYRERMAEVRVVGVCDCGEQGCGGTVCRVVRDGEAVVLRDISGSGIAAVSGTEYRFSEANYQAVVKEIWQHARARRRSAAHEPPEVEPRRFGSAQRLT
jgi:hypothetical protein